MKQIIVCIGTGRQSDVRVRLSLLTLDDAGSILNDHFHSVTLLPGDDPTEARAAIESHIAMPTELSGIPGGPWGAIPDSEWAKVTGVLPYFHTPEAIQKRRDQQAAQDAVNEAMRKRTEEENAKAAAEADAKFRSAVAEAVAALAK